MPSLFDYAVTIIFAREFLEGSVIIGEYRTIILRGKALAPGIETNEALRAITMASVMAIFLAMLVIIAVAVPLAILSHAYDEKTADIIEGCSKVVASICILFLSLKIPKFLGIYRRTKKNKAGIDEEQVGDLTLNSIRFNVAWNVWREFAECGLFLIPSFLAGQVKAIPLSAIIGAVVGGAMGIGIYYANKQCKNTRTLCIMTVLLLVFLSVGLFVGGVHEFEEVGEFERDLWELEGRFWRDDRFPMVILKPFGYSDTRTLIQIICFWGGLLIASLLHYRAYHRAMKINEAISSPDMEMGTEKEEENGNISK